MRNNQARWAGERVNSAKTPPSKTRESVQAWRRRLLDVQSVMTALSVLMLLGAWAAPAMGQDKLWMTQFGTSGHESAHALTPDGAGGVMVAGSSEGNLGGPNSGAYDAFVARYDADGTQLWLRQFGTAGSEVAYALAPDGAGGVMVAGSTKGSLGGPNRGSEDAFVARYDADGTQLWIRQFGTNRYDIASALAPDGAGGVVVAGSTEGGMGRLNAGGMDAYVARYSATGTQRWVRQFGTNDWDFANSIASDGVGGVMVAGPTDGSLGGANAGSSDAFVARYDASGAQLWVRQFGTNGLDGVSALAPDGAGGVIVAGSTFGRLGGANAGLDDVFVARYDANGTQLWVRQFGTSSKDRTYALTPDGAGGVMVAGYTLGSLGGASAGSDDAFIARYDAGGTQLWVRQFGTTGLESARALAPDGAGGVMVAGYTNGSLSGGSAGGYDDFVARYVPCYADLDTSTGVGTLDMLDFFAFQDAFIAGQLAACDRDTSTGWLVCDVFDFLCFQDAFAAGCP